MDLSLNADAALRVYLQPESWNGDAQHRFVFRTEEGDKETLLARLAVVQASKDKGRLEYCVILRPESAERTRVFIVENRWYVHRNQGIDLSMFPHEARHFDWLLFEDCFNDNRWLRGLSRFWRGRDGKREVVLQIGIDGNGEILRFDEALGRIPGNVGFVWRKKRFMSDAEQDIWF